MTRLPVGAQVTFNLPRPVASSKNRRRLFARGRRVMSLPSEQAVTDSALIASLAKLAARGMKFHDDDALAMDYVHDVQRDTVRVTVWKIGELPVRGKRHTKRDVHGMCETIADALQGVLYDDDRNFDEVTIKRAR